MTILGGQGQGDLREFKLSLFYKQVLGLPGQLHRETMFLKKRQSPGYTMSLAVSCHCSSILTLVCLTLTSS